MTSHIEQNRLHIPLFMRLLTLFRSDDSVIDPGATYDRATLHAIRDLPPHILKDIGVTDF